VLNQSFQYLTGETPDSAFVFVASSLNSPVAGSFVKVDDLGFGGTSTGLPELDAVALQVYPSPVASRLNVVAGAPMNELTVLDMTGRTVLHQVVSASDAVMNVADLEDGRYLVRILMKNGKQYVRSFVKQ
jgi:hypothetical protein